MPHKSEVVVDKTTKVEHPGEVCELKGGRCAKLVGVGCDQASSAKLVVLRMRTRYKHGPVHAERVA